MEKIAPELAGERIGSGCFGEVRKAEFQDSRNGPNIKIVAVKLVKDNTYINNEALLTEIKIMSYIGNHINTLNLFGACTLDLDKGEINVFSIDLISWMFQICSGMVFLSSKKIIHRDLACRNVLLCEGKLVKICDFGLARSMLETKKEYYRIRQETPLPMKWMAIESLEDGIFTTQSDVWSFGVVLWELFSLGMLPYNGDVVNADFIQRLKEGHRLRKPSEQPENVHAVMTKCFRKEPRLRPTFEELEKDIRLEIDILLQKILNAERIHTYYLRPDILGSPSTSGISYASGHLPGMEYLPMQTVNLPEHQYNV